MLRTRDTSFVAPGSRHGLFRIHVRERPGGGFQQRFEYVVRGSNAEVDAWLSGIAGSNCTVVRRDVRGQMYALVLTASPVSVPSSLAEVTWAQIRAGDHNGSLAWLWEVLNPGDYD